MTKLKFDLGKIYLPLVKIYNNYVFSMIRLTMYIPIIKAHYCTASVPCETRLPKIWCFRIVLIMIQYFKVTCSITIHNTQTLWVFSTPTIVIRYHLCGVVKGPIEAVLKLYKGR